VPDVLLGQAYYLRFDAKLRRAAQPYAPLGTLYAASYLRSRGHSPALFDAMLAGSEQEWADALERRRPGFAVLYEDSFNYLTKMCLGRIREAAAEMLAQARRHGCATAVAGSDATDHPGEYLRRGAEAVIVGEGEATLVDLLAAWRRPEGRRLADIPGLALPGEGGAAVRTAPRPPLRDLGALPRPAWDLVDVERYRRLWRRRHGCFEMNAVTTRGCPYHCNWCAKPIWGQRYAVRAPEDVAEEVAWLKAAYAPDRLAFVDDIFGLRPGWVEEYAASAERLGAVIPFRCLSRVDLLDEAVVRSLRRAGCRMVWVGAESGSQKILDAMEKGTRVEQVRAAARRLHGAGIAVGFFVQFGYPGETREDIELTRAMVRECRPDDLGISVSYPLPGTPFHRRVEAELGRERNWRDSDDLAMLYRGPFSTPFYRALHRLVHREFRIDAWGRAARSSWRRRAAVAWYRLGLPAARWRLERAARRPHRALPPLRPRLSPEGAARPSEQPS
jgi:anaerobic magnesium-protoporphyrin IX monomethyl ester cyclase